MADATERPCLLEPKLSLPGKIEAALPSMQGADMGKSLVWLAAELSLLAAAPAVARGGHEYAGLRGQVPRQRHERRPGSHLAADTEAAIRLASGRDVPELRCTAAAARAGVGQLRNAH